MELGSAVTKFDIRRHYRHSTLILTSPHLLINNSFVSLLLLTGAVQGVREMSLRALDGSEGLLALTVMIAAS